MTMGHYLRSMRQLTDQWTPTNFRDERRQRLYLKDIDCPPEWHRYLRKIMPPGLFYWNENIEDHGAKDDDLFMEDKTAAPAGDLMSSLPEDMRAQNLMCYIGHEGTYTPAHREMCASLGQNIMVEASGNENGEKEGSSIWFMTETKDREVVREFFLSMLGHDVEIEKHFAQVNAWKKATFPVYIVEQRVGDFILIPPLAPHQVWNRGTRTMKVAWNRTTVETLGYALHEALPRARLVCRDEQYKNKAIIYFTLKKYYEQLHNAADSQMSWLMGEDVGRDSVRLISLKKDFKNLLQLFTEILVDEMFASKEKNVEMIPFDSCITCSYCRSNIFNRFLTCKHCVRDLVGGDQDTYDVCIECYAMGRSCLCVSGLSWCEQWDWSELVDNYEAWRGMVIYNDGFVDATLSPLPLEIVRMKISRKSLAQVCQEQLRRRPFNDITKPDKELEPELKEPMALDDQGNPKKPKRKKKKGDTYKCHTCIHKDYTYRLAFCTNPGCNQAYCFGVLYRAFDMMPQEVLQAERWQCPKCHGICNCGACRRTGNTNPYEPKNTYIGHDTRAVADDRSQEVLVDFRVHNLNWLKAAGDESRNHNSKRIQRLRQQADAEKEKDQDVIGALADGSAPSHTNGSGDHIQGLTALNGVGDYQGNVDGLQQPTQANGAGESADLTALPDPETSLHAEMAYPDPLGGAAERRLGMGYYEQDDSADKILFNPYQEPTAEDILDEESEYVKKSLRAAKRRARQEDDDDPDFVIKKPHKKKKVDKAPQQPDALHHNLDPALLEGEDITMVDASAEAQTEAHAEAEGSGQDDQENMEDQGRPFDPNIPTLRQSRPKVSYADMEDIEEFNEVLPLKPKISPPKPNAQSEASTDPLDLAAEAMRAITNANNVQTPEPALRRRGPGRPRKSDGVARNSPDAGSQASTPQTGSGKRRGPLSRSSLGITSFTLGVDELQSHHDATIGELEQELAKELKGDGKDTYTGSVVETAAEPAAPKRRGRPPKKIVQVPMASTPARALRRGAAPSTVSSERYISMAERMALRGKKFKIGKRKMQDAAKEPTEDISELTLTRVVDTVTQEELEMLQEPEQPPSHEPEVHQEFADHGQPENNHTASMDSPVVADNVYQESTTSRPVSITPGVKAPSVTYSRSSVSSAAPTTSKESSSLPMNEDYALRNLPAAPPAPRPNGPTIVRLGDFEDEGEYSFYSSSFSRASSKAGSTPSDSEDEAGNGDEDIPAKSVAKPALKGQVAKRGREGKGRGRGRGRGRGPRRS